MSPCYLNVVSAKEQMHLYNAISLRSFVRSAPAYFQPATPFADPLYKYSVITVYQALLIPTMDGSHLNWQDMPNFKVHT
jgi:hypothetical protein